MFSTKEASMLATVESKRLDTIEAHLDQLRDDLAGLDRKRR
jgi:hypothetical protein